MYITIINFNTKLYLYHIQLLHLSMFDWIETKNEQFLRGIDNPSDQIQDVIWLILHRPPHPLES